MPFFAWVGRSPWAYAACAAQKATSRRTRNVRRAFINDCGLRITRQARLPADAGFVCWGESRAIPVRYPSSCRKRRGLQEQSPLSDQLMRLAYRLQASQIDRRNCQQSFVAAVERLFFPPNIFFVGAHLAG